MNLQKALQTVFGGNKVRGKSWDVGTYLFKYHDDIWIHYKHIYSDEVYKLNQEDLKEEFEFYANKVPVDNVIKALQDGKVIFCDDSNQKDPVKLWVRKEYNESEESCVLRLVEDDEFCDYRYASKDTLSLLATQEWYLWE